MYVERILDIEALLNKKSHFLFGPRGVGKSSLIQHVLGNKVQIIDLLHSENYTRLLNNPSKLQAMTGVSDCSVIVIDEIQRVPELLNEVHRLIENCRKTFLLTGSSARKLKRQGVNLLAGRARQAELFPFAYPELKNFNLDRFLQFGSLPMVIQSSEPKEELIAYVNTYLQEEIKAEALIKNLPAFSRFLELSALTSGTTLNFSAISNEVGVSSVTLREYYQILVDTFLGFIVEPWKHSVKRKAATTARFYYFDIGVKNCLAHIFNIPKKSDLFGQAFEHFIAMELRAFLSYRRKHLPLYFWRTTNGIEVDFVIDNKIAIEVKATERVNKKHLKGLQALKEEQMIEKYYLISQDPISMLVDGVYVMPWDVFLQKLWADQIL